MDDDEAATLEGAPAPDRQNMDPESMLDAAFPEDGEDEGEQGDEATPENDDGESNAEGNEPDGQAKTEAPVSNVKVKVNGEELEVPLEEVLKSYSNQADLTRQRMEFAEERRAFEAARTMGDASEDVIAFFANNDPLLSSAIQMTAADWSDYAQEDPQGYIRDKAAVEARVVEIQEQASIVQKQRELARLERDQHEAEALTKALPDLPTDPKQLEAFIAPLYAVGEEFGWTREQMDTVNDHRLLVMAHKVHTLNAKITSIESAKAKQVADRPATLRPNTGKTGGISQNIKRLSQQVASGGGRKAENALLDAIDW